ncbi:MAG: hypothetical protein ER33_13080 [Cyanobium sp. CACIAM 14]|nr:MAG: hypothetical protein ER33_13080 [Cyanobium sp. CACIAM 14]
MLSSSGGAWAGVQFENCVTGSDGSLTCDTVPSGGTFVDDVEARYGLLPNAGMGWNEADPHQGREDGFDADRP